jgi:SWIM zinc finger
VELLQGRFSKGVMERICRENNGLFPSPKEIQFSCSCPDWAYMCKHVAAVLYGIGARLDRQPELLFRLHKLDEKELISSAGKELPLAKKGGDSGKILSAGDLSELFGLDLAKSGVPASPLFSTRAGQNKSAKGIRGRKQVIRPGGRQRSR